MSIIKKKVLFLIEGYTGFKKIDESILESISEVKTFNYKTLLDYFNITYWITAGTLLGPIFYLISAEWAILFAGLTAGTVGFLLGEKNGSK